MNQKMSSPSSYSQTLRMGQKMHSSLIECKLIGESKPSDQEIRIQEINVESDECCQHCGDFTGRK
jgi:hypothetical protein